MFFCALCEYFLIFNIKYFKILSNSFVCWCTSPSCPKFYLVINLNQFVKVTNQCHGYIKSD